ncbi:MAG: HEAT repeat domain-containing protein [Planctomycetes bacterium]|nr:HEAT repeat domain-containing protein [Planctomycetota bacterium]
MSPLPSHAALLPLLLVAPSLSLSPSPALAPSLASAQGKGKGKEEDYKEAERLLRTTEEKTVREGAQLCGRLNSVRSIEFLLDVLAGVQPHFRDIAWEVLPEFTDRYARQRIEHELRTNLRDPEIRVWCAQLLGLYGDAAFGGALEKALSDREAEVRRAAAQALGRIRYAPAVKSLLKASKEKDPYLRAESVEALARIDPEGMRTVFLGALADADAGARCALLGALPGLYPDAAEERSAAALSDSDWRPRLQATENLAAIRSKPSLDGLVRATGDARPVVREKAVAALREMTGMMWTERREWWAKNREAFDLPMGKGAAPASQPEKTRVTYHGLQVTSDHVAFLIDKSDTMRARLTDGREKGAAALSELESVLSRLRGDLVFNVFTYAAEVEPLWKAAAPLDERAQKAALSFVEKATTGGKKDIWNALRTVVDDPTLDTLYLLSSGEPEVGLYVHWNRVTLHLKDLNRFHKVVVHTVAYSDSDWYREQLQKIAEATGGKFVGTE